MKRDLICYVLVLWLVVAGSAGAQGRFQQPHRFEKEVKPSEEGIIVVSLKKEGLALIQDMNKYAQGKKKWSFEVMDTTLHSVWSTEIELDTRLVMVGYEYSPQHLYLLFKEGESDLYRLELITISLSDRLYQIDKIKFELNLRLTHFTIAGTSAVFGGYVSSEPAVLLYNQFSDKPKVLPGLFVKDISLLDIRTNQNQSFNVLLADRKGLEKKSLIVRTYDQDGNLLMDDVIGFDPQVTVLSGLTSSLELDEMIIVGTYGENNDRQALGFYSVVVDPFNEQTVTYTDLASLQHSLDFLAPAKAAKIREKALKQKNLKELPEFKTYVNPIRIEERPSGFFLLAEMYTQSSSFDMYPYSPYYYNPSYGYYGNGISPFSSRNYSSYNSPYPYSPVRNASVSMQETMLVQFGPHGEVVRDASMKIDDFKQTSLDQVSDFIVTTDSLIMAYKKENDIFHASTTGDVEEPPVISQTKIKLLDQYDGLRSENNADGHLRYWYDDNLFAWGFQTIKNITKEGKQTRHVFYVNRISLQ